MPEVTLGATVDAEPLDESGLTGALVGVTAGVVAPGAGKPETRPHGAILKPAQRDVSTLRIRPYSLRSIDSPQRALMATQLPR